MDYILNTLVFRNSQRELNELYIPLTLNNNESTCQEIDVLLSSLARNDTVYLNFDKSKQEIRTIQKEIDIVQETDSLLSGL